MSAPRAQYASKLLEDSLGLSAGECTAVDVPEELVDLICNSMTGAEGLSGVVPTVDEAILRFGEKLKVKAIEERGYFVSKARWPNAAQFATCITHDVDNISRPWSHIRAVRKRFSAKDFILASLGLRSLYDNIGLVVDTERAGNVKSSFYLLTSNYPLAQLADRMRALQAEGWEVGLHSAFGTHESPDKMQEDIGRFQSAFGFSPEGTREHFLQFDFEKTWEMMEAAGFVYDTSVGNREEVGFRSGLCTPFHPPNRQWFPLRLLELPLALMDTTLWGYLKLSETDGRKEISGVISRVKEVGGLFCLLWHQEAVRMRGGRLFAEILERLSRSGCHTNTPRNISAWWNARAVPLLRDRGEFRLAGVPPEGLCLEVHRRGGEPPVVKGGTVEPRGDMFLVHVESGAFRMEV